MLGGIAVALLAMVNVSVVAGSAGLTGILVGLLLGGYGESDDDCPESGTSW